MKGLFFLFASWAYTVGFIFKGRIKNYEIFPFVYKFSDVG